MGFSLTTLFLYDIDSSISFFSHSPTGTAKSPKGRNSSLSARCPVWQGAVFYVILGWVLQSQQSFLVCKRHCVHGQTQSITKEEAQVEVNFQRKGEQWGDGNGQRFVMGHVSGQLDKLSLVAVSGPEQCVGNVQKALQSFRLLCLLCGEMAQSAPDLSPWAAQLSHSSTALLTRLGTRCVTGSCPCWKPLGKGGLCCRSTCPAI